MFNSIDYFLFILSENIERINISRNDENMEMNP